VESNSGNDELDSLGKVEVDSGLFDVTLTIPADYMTEGITQDQLDEEAKAAGYQSITLNDDGSATYVMTKAQHKEMMDGISQSINDNLTELVGSEEYPTFVSVEANNDFTQYKVVLNVEEVGVSESIATMGFYMYSGMYHIFNGTEPGNISVQFISQSTGNVIEEANSTDMG